MSPLDDDKPASLRGPRRSPLTFEALEPRLLLNADVLGLDLALDDHLSAGSDLLVRLFTENRRTDARTEAVQRVEIVDAAAVGPDGVLAV
ncbi:MAG: LEPR-XLL domain-containing protein, partial [Pseudomonadota bacterium]